MSAWKDVGVPVLVGTLTVAGSFGAAFFGTQVNREVEERKMDIQMVQIALEILRSDAEDAKLASARAFAIESLKLYSGLDTRLSAEQWTQWQTKGSVPQISLNWPDLFNKRTVIPNELPQEPAIYKYDPTKPPIFWTYPLYRDQFTTTVPLPDSADPQPDMQPGSGGVSPSIEPEAFGDTGP